MKSAIVRFGTALICIVLFTGADWLQFRGSDTNAVAEDEHPPKSLENIAWTADLPGRGASGSIVVDGRVVLTSSSGYNQDRLHVHCFDAGSGEPLWERQLWATGRTQTHRKICVATPTPASDGERIFAFYSSNDLACYDLDGNLLWYRGLGYDYPNASNSLGMASSPIVVGETLIVQAESDAEAFAVGLNVQNGLARWRIDRPRHVNWTSPTLLTANGADEPLVLMQSSEGLHAVRPRTGEVLWSYEDGAATIPSSVSAEGTIYAPSHGITALRPSAGKKTPEKLWQSNRLKPSFASPLIYDNRVFVLNRAGVLTCADAESGERSWQMRLEGPYSSTPVAADGHLYFFNEEGLAHVVDVTGERGEIVAERKLEGTILATPAVADDAVYIRNDDHLWKLAGE